MKTFLEMVRENGFADIPDFLDAVYAPAERANEKTEPVQKENSTNEYKEAI